MNSSLSDLFYITISLNILRQVDVQTLGALPFLQFLNVGVLEIEYTEERLVIGTDHAKFQCLTNFTIASGAMGLMFARGAMPRLVILEVTFGVRETKDTYGNFDLGLENLPSLKQVNVRILCADSRVCEVEDADAAMRMATNMNPNHPSVDLSRHHEDKMIEEEEKLQVDEETMKEEDEEVLIN